MLKPQYHKKFRKDLKLLERRKENIDLVFEVIGMLLEERVLPAKYEDHPLQGKWKGFRDCHIKDDWVLIYKIDRKNSILHLRRSGTHSDLF